jgi:hypothetical protein
MMTKRVKDQMPKDINEMFFQVLNQSNQRTQLHQATYMVPYKKTNYTFRAYRKFDSGTTVVFGKI